MDQDQQSQSSDHVRIKHFDELSVEDISYGAVWIEAEDAVYFDVPLSNSFEEDFVICLPDFPPSQQSQLLELDHFFIGCKATFLTNREFRCLAYVRSSDNQPYHVDLFHNADRCSLPPLSSEASVEDIMRANRVLGVGTIYPFCIEYKDTTNQSSMMRFTFS